MFKKTLINKLLLAIVPNISLAFFAPNIVIAEENTFFCGTFKGVPTTMAKTAKSNVPIIIWESSDFEKAGYPPEKRCQIVSNKFQEHYIKGNGVFYLTTGRKNGENIICVAQLEKGPCADQLFTLKRDANPRQILQQLVQIRDRGSGPLNQQERPYYNINDLINKKSPSN